MQAATLKGLLRSYLQLTKPTISLLVVVTTAPTLLLDLPNRVPSTLLLLGTLVGTYLASSSAAIFNHLIDADIDQDMHRTRGRPIPTGQVHSWVASCLGVVLGSASILILWTIANPLTAMIAFGANVFYVVVYTWYLKRRTVQNIVIGGAAGAVGPLIGEAALRGQLGITSWMLFLLIFLWTPPHFWSLALKYKLDYARANIPMLPVVYGERVTRRQILIYSLTLLIPIIILFASGYLGLVYFIPSLLMTVYFCYLAYKLLIEATLNAGMKLFHYSCFYLFGIFGAIAFDRLLTAL